MTLHLYPMGRASQNVRRRYRGLCGRPGFGYGKKLTIVTQHRHLGIIFQHNLRWTHHIEHILRKTYKSFNLLFRLPSALHHSALSRTFTTHILPILQYACIAVTPVPSTALDRLERFQRKAAKVCLRLPIYAHIDHSSLVHRIHWPTIFSRRKIIHIIFSHAILSHIRVLGIALPAQITPAYGLRHSRTYRLVTTRTDCCMNSPLYKALDNFNSLPILLRSISSPLLFRKGIHSLLLNSVCAYSNHPTPQYR